MSIVLFFLVLAVLILSHEFGHFISAKLSGVKVEEFGFGFPPRIFGTKKKSEEGTIYSVNLIPFGGFVKIFGEEGEKSGNKKSFSSKPIYIRALILAAGVLFNLFLAWPFLSAGYFIGAPVSLENKDISGATIIEKGVMVIQVQEKTPAEKAGLQAGDFLLQVISKKDDKILNITSVEEAQNFIKTYAGTEIQINYQRNGKKLSTSATPLTNPEEGRGSLGIAMDKVGVAKYPFGQAVWEGLKSTFRLTSLVAQNIFYFFSTLFSEKSMIGQVAGPIGIAGIIGSATQAGPSYLFQLIALLSINLALINIIPFPALDGGRILFLAIEFVRRKPISQKTSNIANNIGFAILILLMVAITYQDILRIAR